MLTIKKRFPFNRMYVFASAAFIVGYAGFFAVLGVLPQKVAYDSLSVAGTSPLPTKVQSEASNDTTTTTDAPVTAPTQPGETGTAVQEETPAAETPAEPTPTTPTEPTPTEPTPEPEPEPDPNPLDPIIDILNP